MATWFRASLRPEPHYNSAQRLNILDIRAQTGANPLFKYSTDRLTVNAEPAILNLMVERLDMTFAALSDPTRRAMLASLSSGERSIGDLAAPHAMSFAGAAKHVGVLERAGLVERRKAGRTQLCRLRAEPMREADAWLKQWESFWTERLDVLEAILKTEKEQDR